MQALDCGEQALVIVAAKGATLPVVFVNTAFETLTGLSSGDVVGSDLQKIVTSGDMPGAADGCQPGEQHFEQHWQLKGGGDVQVSVRLSPLFERPGQPSFWLLTATAAGDEADAGGEAALRSELHDARRRLKTLERSDAATGIPNEDSFAEILQRDWAIARRERRRLTVVLFKVDFLEEYRNSLGRHATDSVLQKVGHAINGSLRRAGDFGARVGDDRFAALIGTASESQAGDFAARALRKVSDLAIPHPRSPVARTITVSFGVAAEVPDRSLDCDTLMEVAEQQLLVNQPEAAPEKDGTGSSESAGTADS